MLRKEKDSKNTYVWGLLKFFFYPDPYRYLRYYVKSCTGNFDIFCCIFHFSPEFFYVILLKICNTGTDALEFGAYPNWIPVRTGIQQLCRSGSVFRKRIRSGFTQLKIGEKGWTDWLNAKHLSSWFSIFFMIHHFCIVAKH